MTFSDRNFNIRSEYVERLPRTRAPRRRNDDGNADLEEAVVHVFVVICVLVVLIIAGSLLLAFLGWLHSWAVSPQPQPQLQPKKECATCQSSESQTKHQKSLQSQKLESREMKSFSPSPQRRNERSFQRPSGFNEAGASAPSFQWVCDTEVVPVCGLRDPNGRYVQAFRLEGGQLLATQIDEDAIRPKSWGCRNDGNKIYCAVDGQTTFYDGVREGH